MTNGGANSVAIVPLAGLPPHSVAGLVPTGWYPTAVSVSADGGTMWVANNKSEQGPNPEHLTSATSRLTQTTYPGGNAAAQVASAASNQYILQLEHSGLLTAPVPRAEDLTSLTLQVAANNGYRIAPNRRDEAVMSFLGRKIKHIVYIVKENRTFDQVLGDLNNGSNGDPSLTVFGRQVTPNFHRLSDEFVTLDNFFCTGEVSGNGWPWSTAGRETDFNEKDIRLNYAPGAVARSKAPYDAEGENRNVNVGVQGGAGAGGGASGVHRGGERVAGRRGQPIAGPGGRRRAGREEWGGAAGVYLERGVAGRADGAELRVLHRPQPLRNGRIRPGRAVDREPGGFADPGVLGNEPRADPADRRLFPGL